MLELRVQRGLASLDNNGAQLANQIGRNSRVLQSTMKLPALTYTCTDLHISHPEIYNSNLVARQGQTVAKTSASQCTYIRHRTTCKCPIGAYATDIHVYGTDIHPAKDAYATDIHAYGTDIHPG